MSKDKRLQKDLNLQQPWSFTCKEGDVCCIAHIINLAVQAALAIGLRLDNRIFGYPRIWIRLDRIWIGVFWIWILRHPYPTDIQYPWISILVIVRGYSSCPFLSVSLLVLSTIPLKYHQLHWYIIKLHQYIIKFHQYIINCINISSKCHPKCPPKCLQPTVHYEASLYVRTTWMTPSETIS